jgi:hypothetical protein
MLIYFMRQRIFNVGSFGARELERIYRQEISLISILISFKKYFNLNNKQNDLSTKGLQLQLHDF